MGISNRDYIRDDNPRQFSSPAKRDIIQSIIIVTVIVYLVQLFVPPVTKWLYMSLPGLQQGQIWRVLTYAFCHDVRAIFHILFNMFILWIFGREIAGIYGDREFLYLYLTAAIFAALTYLGIQVAIDRVPPMLGASGAVMAVEVLYALHFPRRIIRIWGIIPIEARWLILLLISFDVYPVIQELAGNRVGSGVAHSAHLGGVLFSFLYWKFDLRIQSMLPSISLKNSKIRNSNLKIHRPENSYQQSSDLDNKVDEILAKIHAKGEASLTKKEREIMKEASKRYKKR